MSREILRKNKGWALHYILHLVIFFFRFCFISWIYDKKFLYFQRGTLKISKFLLPAIRSLCLKLRNRKKAYVALGSPAPQWEIRAFGGKICPFILLFSLGLDLFEGHLSDWPITKSKRKEEHCPFLLRSVLARGPRGISCSSPRAWRSVCCRHVCYSCVC